MVSSDPLAAISPHNVTRLIHLVEKFSKNPFLLDPVKAAEAAQLNSLTVTFLKKYGSQTPVGVQSDIPKTKSSREKLWSTIELIEEEASHPGVEAADKRWGCIEEESFWLLEVVVVDILFMTHLPRGRSLESFASRSFNLVTRLGF